MTYLLYALTLGSMVVSEILTAYDIHMLVTAAVTFGVGVITLVGGELIKLFTAYLRKRRSKYEELEEGDKRLYTLVTAIEEEREEKEKDKEDKEA